MDIKDIYKTGMLVTEFVTHLRRDRQERCQLRPSICQFPYAISALKHSIIVRLYDQGPGPLQGGGGFNLTSSRIRGPGNRIGPVCMCMCLCVSVSTLTIC